jgi:hypothetical protein
LAQQSVLKGRSKINVANEIRHRQNGLRLIIIRGARETTKGLLHGKDDWKEA